MSGLRGDVQPQTATTLRDCRSYRHKKSVKKSHAPPLFFLTHRSGDFYGLFAFRPNGDQRQQLFI
jgi:hypothetical protein